MGIRWLETNWGPNVQVVLSDAVYYAQPTGNPESGTENQELDVYRPNNSGATNPPPRPEKSPTMLLIHGGGFTGGAKGNNEQTEWGGTFCSRGYRCVTINYALEAADPTLESGCADDWDIPAGTDPTIYQEAANPAITAAVKALEWMVTNADTYGFDLTRIGIMGNSVGALVALELCYCRTDIPPEITLRSCFCLWGSVFGTEDDVFQPGGIPLFIAQGTSDSLIPYEGVEAMANRCKEVGIVVEDNIKDGEPHGLDLDTVLSADGDGKTLRQKSVDFAYKYMAHRPKRKSSIRLLRKAF